MNKKRDVRAKLLFCQSQPIAFWPFSLPLPSLYVKHNMICVKSSSHLFFPRFTSFHPVAVGPRTIYKGGSFLRVVIGSSSFGSIN